MRIETELAITAAHRAGKMLACTFDNRKLGSFFLKKNKEVVSEADYEANDIIISRIKKTFPNHRILSEETEKDRELPITNQPTWIIDPLDGTSNFVSHIPLFAVAIALVENGVTTMSIIHDPLHDDTYVAEKGQGTFLNWEPIRVAENQIRPGTMLFAGRGHENRDKQRHRSIIYTLEEKMPYFRRLGSASIMMALVAAGRAEAVILTGNKPWDIVPGALLIKEAGGKLSDYCGRSWRYQSDDIVASNGFVHDSIIRLTKDPIDNNQI